MTRKELTGLLNTYHFTFGVDFPAGFYDSRTPEEISELIFDALEAGKPVDEPLPLD